MFKLKLVKTVFYTRGLLEISTMRYANKSKIAIVRNVSKFVLKITKTPCPTFFAVSTSRTMDTRRYVRRRDYRGHLLCTVVQNCF